MINEKGKKSRGGLWKEMRRTKTSKEGLLGNCFFLNVLFYVVWGWLPPPSPPC